MTLHSPVSPVGMRVAVIGLGRMGLRHVQAARSLGMQVVGGADPGAAARTAAVADHDLPAAGVYADSKAMLAALKPEAVVVASTAPSHADLVLAAGACSLVRNETTSAALPRVRA